jgi:hypothetical protein
LIKNYTPKRQKEPRKTTEDFWMRETGTGQQMAQLLGSYMMMMMKEGAILDPLHYTLLLKKFSPRKK